MLVTNDDSIKVIGEASTAAEALSMIEKESPEVLITDISMPGMSGIDLTKSVRNEYPDTNVLVLSTYVEEEYITSAFEAGALGYLPKDTNEEEFIAAIKSVANGDVYYTHEVSNILTRSLINKKRSHEEYLELTEREIEILKLVVEGLSNKMIADKLFISVRTVDTHRRNIMEKVDAKNSADLVRKAFENNLV